MTDNESAADNDNGIDLPSRAYEFGVDATGATHYHSAFAHKVWVVEDGEIATTFDVDDIEDFRAHVADTRGWEESIDYGEGDLGAWLAEILEDVTGEEVRA